MGWEDRPYYREGRTNPGGPWQWLMNGSVTLFHFAGIRVRAHSSLVITIVLVLVFGVGNLAFHWQDRLQVVTTLFVIVLLHEFGHCFTARWVGGSADDILMTPIGGLAFAHPPRRPLPTFLTVAGGPSVNIVICFICGIYLHLAGYSIPWIPWAPSDRGALSSLFDLSNYVYWAYRASWAIFLFNLWPVFPLDGGQMLQSILWPHLGYLRSMKISAVVGMVGSVVMFLVGVTSGALMLMLIAVSCFYTCYMMRLQLQHASPYDFDESGLDYSASAFMKEPRRSKAKQGWFAQGPRGDRRSR